jgi:hypothetical protein
LPFSFPRLRLIFPPTAAFNQCTIADHPIFANVHLKDLLTNLPPHWSPALLPPTQRTLVHAVLAFGSFLSFSAEILGEGSLPGSFDDLNQSVEAGAIDLREFGRRRKQQCAALIATAEKLTKENDVAFEVSLENAGIALLLDSMATMREFSPSLPFLDNADPFSSSDDTSASFNTPRQSRPWL